ncbi:MAG: hypothetical protein OXN17_07850 [Candidatus Poribacteria bacterium]|nr:hypothetical protein [Candidatus Poribacteria bacterium]MDE0505915.1 hypothetical protein [Candidatus Poribacteria bacterium]
MRTLQTDAEGKIVATMGTDETGGVVGVSDSEGKPAAAMMVNAVGVGIVAVFGKPGTANYNALIPE